MANRFVSLLLKPDTSHPLQIHDLMQLPDDFKKSIEKRSVDTEAFFHSLETTAPVSIRLNPAKMTTSYNGIEQVAWHPHGRYLPERPVFTLDPLFQAGTYYVQEASSMFLHHALMQTTDLTKKLKVLDLCAAPGGKTTLLASALTEDSFLLANEVIRKRIDPLQHNLTKWGNANVMVSNHDPADFSALAGFFDVVCVDAPCSGEGLFRKDPNAMSEWSLEHVGHCSARQKRILQEAMGLVAEGGVLIYSTCTFNEEENDLNLHWVCQQDGFNAIDLKVPDEWGIQKTEFGYQCFPHLVKGEGFYLGALRKSGVADKKYFKNKSFSGMGALPKNEVGIVSNWFAGPDHFSFFQKPNNEIVAVPKTSEEDFTTVAAALKRRSSGLEIGMIKQKHFIPSHAFALSQIINPDLPNVELEKGDALLYLKKEECDMGKQEKGWHLIRHGGFNLGWVKLLGNRYNNYLPNEWRIRMELD